MWRWWRLDGPDIEVGARFSPDEGTAYLTFGPPGGEGHLGFAVAENGAYGTLQAIAEIDGPEPEIAPAVSGDGLTLVFTQNPQDGDETLWMSRRASVDAAWGAPVHLSALDAPPKARHPYLTPDGEELWYATNGGIVRATRDGETYSNPQTVFPVTVAWAEPTFPSLSGDGREIIFGEHVDDNTGASVNIYRAERATVDDAFGEPEAVEVPAPAQTSTHALVPTWLSLDGCRLYSYSISTQDPDILVSDREP